jgi:transcription antitermination factor NusG
MTQPVYETGDMVVIIRGKYIGRKGMIVSVNGAKVNIGLLDQGNKPGDQFADDISKNDIRHQ